MGIDGVAATSVGSEDDGSGGNGGEDDRYIVGTDSRAAVSTAKKKARSVHRVLEFGDIGQAVAGRFSEPARKALEKRDDVRYIEPDGTMEAIGQSTPWGVDRIDADRAHDDGYTGSGADIAIIDTGIDSDHPDLQDNIGTGKAFVECGNYSDGSSCSDTNGNSCHEAWDDDHDHGTHCAGIAGAIDDSNDVVGVSTEATLHAVKVLDCAGYGSYSDVAAGIEYVADRGWDVASMSLGGTSASSTVRDACQYAYEKGVFLVAAAGNSGPCSDCVKYPAKYDTVVAVSATDSNDDLADFSSTGPEIELAAPGQSINSTIPGGTAYYSGTSMACPHVSGAGGLLMANGYSNTGARDRLQDVAEDIGLSNSEQGNGLLDVGNAVGDGGSDTSPIGEVGRVSTDQPDGDTWHVVNLEGTYTDPTVIMNPVGWNGGQPAHVRLRNVGKDRFEFQIEEWLYMDGAHKSETIHYLVLEAGRHTLSDGTTMEVGTATTNHESTRVSFTENFDSPPVMFSQSQTVAGGQPIVTRQWNVTSGGFTVRVQEAEGMDGAHKAETVGYVALDSGSHGDVTAGRTSESVTHAWHQVDFGTTFDGAPMFIGQMQTNNGWQPAALRYRNLADDGVEVRVQEERSADDEIWHKAEAVGYLLVTDAGTITSG